MASKDVLQTVDPEVLAEIDALISGTTHAALAVVTAEDQYPHCSRVAYAHLAPSAFLICVSALAEHTPALVADPRCSLLIAAEGKGDPLTHARITILAEAQRLTDSAEINAARSTYLAAHPKAKIYIDLPDFTFFKLTPISARYNAGFGRAYALSATELGVA